MPRFLVWVGDTLSEALVASINHPRGKAVYFIEAKSGFIAIY